MNTKPSNMPAFTVHIVREEPGKKAQWFEVGALWQGNNSFSGDTVFGRLVVIPKDAE